MDSLTPEKRSWNMSRIKGKDTKPELLVRSLLHRAGYRFTVNGPKNKSLPGRPDIVLRNSKRLSLFTAATGTDIETANTLHPEVSS